MSRAKKILAVVGSVVLLGVAFSRADLPATLALLSDTRPFPLLLAVLLGPVQIVLSAIRWRMVAAQLGPTPSVREATEEYALSTLLNFVLPSGIGGDALRTWRHHRQWGATGQTAVFSTLLERGAGQFVLASICLTGLLLWPVLHPDVARPAGLLLLTGVILAAMILLALGPASLPGIGRFCAATRQALRRPPVMVLSLVVVASYIAGFSLCAIALGLPPRGAVLTGIPLILLAMSLPLSVGGWGIREAAAVTILPVLGWSSEAALAVAGLYGISTLLGASPGVIVLLRRDR